MAESPQRVSLDLCDPHGPRRGGCPPTATCCRSRSPGTARSTCPWWPRSRGRTGPRRGPGVDPASQPGRRRPATAVRPADPRRPARRPVAVHPPGRAGRGLGGGRAAAVPAATDPPLPTRLMGTRPGYAICCARTVAPRPVTRAGRSCHAAVTDERRTGDPLRDKRGQRRKPLSNGSINKTLVTLCQIFARRLSADCSQAIRPAVGGAGPTPPSRCAVCSKPTSSRISDPWQRRSTGPHAGWDASRVLCDDLAMGAARASDAVAGRVTCPGGGRSRVPSRAVQAA